MCYVTVTLMTFDKQSNGRRIVVVTTALCGQLVDKTKHSTRYTSSLQQLQYRALKAASAILNPEKLQVAMHSERVASAQCDADIELIRPRRTAADRYGIGLHKMLQ